MKPKRGLISSMQNTSIKIPDKFKSDNVHIQNSIEKLRTDCHIEEQQRLIKVLPEYLASTEDSEFVTSLLTYLFITIDSKHPIRKTISRILLTASTDLIKKTLSGNILYLINIVKDEEDFSYNKRFEVILNLQNCFNNFPPGVESISYIIDEVTPFTVDFFVHLVDLLGVDESEHIRKSDVHSYIYNVTKLLVSVLQQCILSQTLPEYSSRLMLAAYKVITNEYISFDTKSNCGLLMVVSAIHIPDHIANDFRFKTNPCLCLLKFDKLEDDNQGFFNFKDLAKNYTANLCVYSGILNVVPQNILCEEVIDGVPVISFMFGKLLECAKKCTGKPTQILEVSRALILISKIMNTIPLSYVEPMFVQGLEYVWTHLDHFVDTVKHSARTIFENLIKLAHRHYKDGFTTLLNLILTNMIDLLVFRCTHYVALTILSNETGVSFLLQQFCHLPFILLINIVDSSISPQICNTYELLMSQHAREEPGRKWSELWVDLVKPLLQRSVPPVTQYYQRLLMSACKIRPIVLQGIMPYKWYTGPNELGALIGCLRIARKSGFQVPLEEEGLSEIEKRRKYWRNYIEYDFLDSMMCHQSDEVRIAILALVVESQKSTEIFSQWELSYLKKYFYFNVTTQAPNTRQQIIAYFKKAITRIKEGLAVLTRHSTILRNRIQAEGNDASKAGFIEELQMYKKQEVNYKVFMENLFKEYLCAGIQEGANYPRRATCLELILFMLTENCIELEELEKNWKPIDTMSILNILVDSYETNISTAFQIIKKLPISIFVQFHSKDLMRYNLNNTISLASAIKPTTVTSAGYKLQVLLMSPHAHELILEALDTTINFDDTFVLAIALFMKHIESGLEQARQHLLSAVKNSPVYGHILCIRHLLEKEDFSQCTHWEYILTRLVELCRKVNELVSPIVNNSSPEGYMPTYEEVTNKESNETVTSQMVVVYAWRTVKEVSLLLGVLALKAPALDLRTGKQLLTKDIMHNIEQHFFTLFLETKHRGAYEQAYLGFCKFCEKLWRSHNAEYRTWPKIWLGDILKIMKGEIETYPHTLCPTRRSAGLPFMIQAIVITEPRDVGNENFHMCMKNLLKIAAETSEEEINSRIHGMNVLRSLYRNNHLGELVAPYIAQGVITSLNAFNHEVWGVRNAATLLFSTLVTRMFGVQRTKNMEEISLKNRMSARVFFMRYSELYDYLLQQLIKATESEQNNIALQPVLLILERLYSCNSEEETQLGRYLPYVTKCLSSPVYKVRELAAQTATSLIPNLEAVTYILQILYKLADVTLTNNCCQGLILQVMDLLRTLNKGYTPLDVPDLIESTFWIPIAVGKHVSHYTAALYLDMIISLTNVFRRNCQGASIFAKLVEILVWQTVKDSGIEETLSTAKKKYNVSRLNIEIHIVSTLYTCDNYFKSLYLKEHLLNGLASVHDEINQFSLNCVNYLNFDHPRYMKHSLYVAEQLETNETEMKLVNGFEPPLRAFLIENVHRDMGRKFVPFFYDLLDRSKECCLCVLLMIQHYPCILIDVKPSQQEILDFFINWCRCDDDEMYCASLSVISTFLNSLNEHDLRLLNFSVLFKVIVEASSPLSTLHQRIAVAQFLVANKRLFCESTFFISVDDLSDLWHVVIILLEDDDHRVRDAVSQLCISREGRHLAPRADGEYPVIAEKAREDLLHHCVENLPPKIITALLLSWALRRTPEDEKDSVELFDKGEMNVFAEEEQLAKLAVCLLKEFIWRLEDGLKYDDLSIFVEEHTYVVATTIYNTLYRNLPTAVNTSIRISLLCILKKLLDFLDKCPINNPEFHKELGRLVLQEFLSMSMQKTNANTNRIKYILKSIFDIEHGWPH